MDHFETLLSCFGQNEVVNVGFSGARINLTELRPFELNHFRYFLHCRVRSCVINSSHSFHVIVLKSCILVVDVMKMCT